MLSVNFASTKIKKQVLYPMKKLFSTLTLLVLGITAMVAQVTFSVSYKRVSPTELDIVFTGKIPAGWHVYSTHVDEGGPTPTTFQVDKLQGAKLKGALVEGPGKRLNTTRCLT